MNLVEMRGIVRRDLHDEDAANYRWTDDELDRHIAHAVKEYSEAIPDERQLIISTVAGSREVDIIMLTDRVMIEAVEYPYGNFPGCYQRFALWGDKVSLLGDEIPDGSNACVYYGKLHTVDSSGSTIDARHEELVIAGACGFAAVESAVYSIIRVNVGGATTPGELLTWGNEKLDFFRSELKRLGRRNRVRMRSLYRPALPPVSKSTDYGP